jgi:hypothetical protein
MTDEEITDHLLRRLRAVAEQWPDEIAERRDNLRNGMFSISICAYIEAIARDPLLLHALDLRAAEISRKVMENDAFGGRAGR